MDRIIDVSKYQGSIDWAAVKASGVAGAILRAVSSNKSGLYIDPTFEHNYAECKRLGIPVGAYYYTYALDEDYMSQELLMFGRAITGKSFELPLAVDVEDNSLKTIGKAKLSELVKIALEYLEDIGAYVMIYTYTAFKPNLDSSIFDRYDLWQADYRAIEPSMVGMWQFTSQASVSGINVNVDMSYAYRDYPAIIKAHNLNNFTGIDAEPEPEPNMPADDPSSDIIEMPSDDAINKDLITKILNFIDKVIHYIMEVLK